MKFAVAFFALVAIWGVNGSNPKVNEAWVQGARTVDAPVTELTLSGEQLKDDVIKATNNYLLPVDVEFSRLFGTWSFEVQTKCSRNHKEIEDKLIHLQVGGDADFTNQLAALANEYKMITSGINGVGRMSQKLIQRVGADLNHLQASNSRLVTGFQRYSMEEQFFSYRKVILERDFEILRKWLLDLLAAGYQNVQTNASRMEKNHRLDNLWPLVDSLQKQSHSIENDSEVLEAHTNAAVFKEYIKARADLWAINVAQKMNEDQH